jgi:hypothetical protein
MAAKGTAAKSASGASMSKYDVEVEKRLQALESKGGTSGDANLARRVEIIEEILRRTPGVNFDKLSASM